ncbi:cytochrome P450, partial [Mycena crocata]
LSALGTFILSMVLNPQAQKKAQAGIDSVVKEGHLPDFDDSEVSLPYVSAIVKEVLRWRPVTPLALPHFVPVDAEYRGYTIPADSILIANAWCVVHLQKQNMYPDPYKFNPKRFLLNGKLNPDIKDPDAGFGFGRRIFPGRHMAVSSIWIVVASTLATFDITKAIGDDGKVIEPDCKYLARLVMYVAPPFKCSIKPRSQNSAELIEASALSKHPVDHNHTTRIKSNPAVQCCDHRCIR